MKRYLTVVMLGFVLLAIPARADEKQIEIKDYQYIPVNLTVPVGTKVTWINRDEVPHTVTEVNKTFGSAALDTDDSFSTTFSGPGIYKYYCRLHPNMTGTITVTADK
jgi:plastocyanin